MGCLNKTVRAIKGKLSVNFISAKARRNYARATLFFALALSLTCAVQAQITLNLKEVEIEDFIQMVSEVAKKNFVVDTRVKGKVTVISAAPMSEDELYQVFLSTLSVYGFAAVPSGKVIKIVPEMDAKTDQSALAGENIASGDSILTQVIEIQHVSAAQLVPILRPLVPQQGHLAAHPEKNMLIISDRAGNVARMAKIIQRLDKAESAEIDVIVLEHAGAAEVVRILNNLEAPSAGTPGIPAGPTLLADERTNSILIGGERSARLRLRALIAHLDTPLQTLGNTQVIYLRHAQAEDLARVLEGVSESMTGEKRAEAGSGKSTVTTRIQADANTNSLIITAAPDELQSLRRVVEQLDIRRAQILVEGIIAEIRTDISKELGVQWVVDGTPGGEGPVGLVNFGSPGGGLVDLAATVASGTFGNAASVLGNGALLGIGRFDSNSLNFGVLLRALTGNSGSNVLSTPSLVTLDNQEAEIVVGQNVPFLTGQYTNTGASTGATNPFQTIQRQNVGLQLKVKPQVNEGDTIKLHIEQEVSSLLPSLGTVDVVTSVRTIKTTVLANNNQIVVLGGLIDETLTDTAQKVPGLGDLPLLGGLFRYKKASKEKRNLMVFLHPVILRDSTLESQISRNRYTAMRNHQLAYREQGVAFTDRSDIPVLPDLDAFLTILPDSNAPVYLPK
jgi:general secretion pathway protein D